MQTPNSNSTEGTIISVIRIDPPWPRQKQTVLLTQTINQCNVRVLCNPDSRFQVDLLSSAGVKLSVLSCPVALPVPTTSFIAVTWKLPEELELRLNPQLIASTVRLTEVPGQYIVPATEERHIEVHDYSKSKAEAAIKRLGKATGHRTKPNRKPGDEKHLANSLTEERQQIIDLTELVRRGATAHARGLAARLRLTIAQGDPLPLLQLYAANKNLPVTIYTAANTSEFITDFDCDWAIDFAARTQPTKDHGNPIDLDVYLDSFAGVANKKSYTHREILNAVGNTIGAHSDPDIHPVLEMLRSIGAGAGETEQTGLVLYLFEMAEVVISLSGELLATSEQNES